LTLLGGTVESGPSLQESSSGDTGLWAFVWNASFEHISFSLHGEIRMTEYKRKFLVEGDSIKKDFYGKYCCKPCSQSAFNPKHRRCFGIGSLSRPFQECIHREKIFHEYIVSETIEGGWQCSCKAWTTHKPRQDCKHILKVKANPKKYQIATDFTAKTIETIKKVTG